MPASVTDKAQRGATAEAAALAHLQSAGLQLLARNVRYPFGELDLVMREGATLAFVEVRFRGGAGFGGAAASVDAGKRRKIARAAQAWLGAHRAYAKAPCRFDVVAISPAVGASGGDAGGQHCDWIRAAFTLDDLW